MIRQKLRLLLDRVVDPGPQWRPVGDPLPIPGAPAVVDVWVEDRILEIAARHGLHWVVRRLDGLPHAWLCPCEVTFDHTPDGQAWTPESEYSS